MKYVAALNPASVPPVAEADAPEPTFSADVDVLLNPSERAQRLAWIAHIESALGDLVVRRGSLFQLPNCSSKIAFLSGPRILLRFCKLRRRHASHPIFLL